MFYIWNATHVCINAVINIIILPQISQDQVMMSHSPLRMFRKYHDKCVLVSGQGPVLDIAKKYLFILFHVYCAQLLPCL